VLLCGLFPGLSVIVLKSLIGGVVGALLVSATWLAAELTLIWLRTNRLFLAQSDAGGLGAVSVTSYVPEAAYAGFLIGAWWEWRRATRQAAVKARK